MINPILIIQLIFGIVQFFVGIMANGIIILVSSLECIKQKRVIAYDFLLTSLGIFRIFLHGLIITCHLIFFFTLELYVSHEAFLFFFFINEVNLWLATYLCVFYCIKIANIVCPFFLWLKRRISRLVPWLILGSLLFSIAISVAYNLLYWSEAKEELRKFLIGNISSQVFFYYLFPTPLLVVGLATPLYIFNAASFLLIYSLCSHIRQMRSIATGFRDSRTEAHIRAMKLVFSFFILYTSYYFVILLSFSSISIKKDVLIFFCFPVAGLYPSGHSVILILGNSKLKHYTKKFLLSAKHCLRRGSALDSAETQ
ncbi:taste receptor type 2 member 1 [Sminthopsis crassicaudata]|uniref:taste receptor type 2 member 1 n=1 Tax=Sminthopsis crassicaudata TaxID=9301 RepID=UPI003D6887F5